MERTLENAKIELLRRMSEVYSLRKDGSPLLALAIIQRHAASDRVAELHAMVNPKI